MFWLIGTAFALRTFLTLTTLGGSTRDFREIRDLLVFWGLGDLEKFYGPVWGQKRQKVDFPLFHESVFSSFSALGASFRGRAH